MYIVNYVLWKCVACLIRRQIATDLVKLAVQSYGQIDGIILNHGILDNQKLRDTSIERIKYVYDVNVYSCLALVRVAVLSA